MRLEDFAAVVGPRTCRWCGTIMPPRFETERGKQGYAISGRQGFWHIYVRCPLCKFKWPIWRLTYPTPEELLQVERLRTERAWTKRPSHEW